MTSFIDNTPEKFKVKLVIVHFDIRWNFHKFTMEFKVQGRWYVLKGATTSDVRTIKKQELYKTLVEGEHLSMMQLCTAEKIILSSLLFMHTNLLYSWK